MKFKKYTKSIIYWLLFIIVTITLAILSRVLFFGVFTIPTPSMEPAILAGDRVIVNKLVPGSRIITNIFSLKKGEKANYRRLSGYRGVKRNDVLIFNFPYSNWNRLDIDPNLFYAKRCVAIPGDTFYIDNGIYRVKNISDTLGNYENQFKLSELRNDDISPEGYGCFPFHSDFNWNIKNFGPLYVPKEGDTMELDAHKILLYKNLISYETKEPIEIREDNIYLGDSLINEYAFQKNYYFMAGDLVFDSQDSRYWGLLPEEHIVGKVSFVYKSVDSYNGKVRWNRMMKSID